MPHTACDSIRNIPRTYQTVCKNDKTRTSDRRRTLAAGAFRLFSGFIQEPPRFRQKVLVARARAGGTGLQCTDARKAPT
jgi:hypothetical protein